MNKQRRKHLVYLLEKLEEAQVQLSALAEEERDYFDNMPEGIQTSEKGEKADDIATQLEDIAAYIEEQINELQCVINEA
ncbi:MAG: hypothetical protein IPM50_09320 [Acidobacteriota bacterium]|nr:MAG: hypothetical protein IPM50_09320 [Acidobacteriota bacterium]